MVIMPASPGEVPFTCLRCGHCCNRILITQDGVHMGLCLFPGEKKLFKKFPNATLPYIALRKPGHDRRQVVCYQLIQSPCPLYDAVTQTCMVYENRPTACKAYPFSAMHDGAYSLENTCGWARAEQVNLNYGETPVRPGADQNRAVSAMGDFFVKLHKRMRRTGYTQLIIFDVETHKWVDIGRVP